MLVPIPCEDQGRYKRTMQFCYALFWARHKFACSVFRTFACFCRRRNAEAKGFYENSWNNFPLNSCAWNYRIKTKQKPLFSHSSGTPCHAPHTTSIVCLNFVQFPVLQDSSSRSAPRERNSSAICLVFYCLHSSSLFVCSGPSGRGCSQALSRAEKGGEKKVASVVEHLAAKVFDTVDLHLKSLPWLSTHDGRPAIQIQLRQGSAAAPQWFMDFHHILLIRGIFMICQYSIFCASLRRPWEICSLQSPLSLAPPAWWYSYFRVALFVINFSKKNWVLAAAIEQQTKTKPNKTKTKTKQDRDERRKETKGQRKNAEYAQIEFDF